MRKYCSSIRVIVHTQEKLLKYRNKKTHIMEVQVNGGTIAERSSGAASFLRNRILADQVSSHDEMIDTIGVTRGKGFNGVTSRWHTKKLPRKTRKVFFPVACIGAWHPSRVQFTVALAGQKGDHHRTEINKKIYRIGKSPLSGEGKANGATEFDLTEKTINPMGGFPHYGVVKRDYLMTKGAVIGHGPRPL
ncbi:hypothetical protein PMAYCL1PPCAC_23834, partial [Pristionchus mayeri]